MCSGITRRGFTLVEMSVVLVVIAIIAGMGISAGIDALESTRRVATESKLDVIEKALLNFREQYGRLPCPGSATLAATDTNYGVEAANLGTCTGGTPAATYVTVGSPTGIPSGAVPVRTLGLPNEFMVDGWGGKFHYEVAPAMTADGAFSVTQPGDACPITVVDHSGANMPLSSVYALVSYGKNGIGAYGKGGAQQTGGTAGAAEQTNIRTTTNTPTIRVKNGASGARGTAGYYDDIVRFKSLYQMMTNPQRDTLLYKGPELALTYNTTSGTQIVYGKKKCGRYQEFSGTVPSAVAAVPRFIGFTPGNTHLFVYHTNNCKLYSISGTTLTAVTSGTPVPNCPAAGTGGAMAEKTALLAINDTSSPYLRLYRMTGEGMAATFAEMSSAISPALTDYPDSITFSNNAEWMALSRGSSYAYLYSNEGDYFQDVGTLSGDSYTEYRNAISPDGRYYAINEVSGGNTNIYIWRNISGTFSQITSGGSALLYTITNMTVPYIFKFSPDSNYLVIGGTSTGENLVVLSINPVTDAVTQALGVTSTVPVSAQFSSDSKFLAVARDATGSGGMAIYRRTGNSFSSTAESTSGYFTFNGSDLANGIALSH
ncbi:MAG: prepilin-type N-terminal cleavage/methylation domain-containing protein [Alphaproteobacteria bacterium]|nr:prepilin-type N-terminal cleavage/methylation domain-containing protein [Alphaproteobacteria bacterium]